MRYDPFHPIDSESWLALDEFDRIDSVMQYHRKARVRLPNERVHASIHVVVENQLALGEPVRVRATLKRLMNEGLDRHEAIHAIGTLVAEQLYGALTGKEDANELSQRYSEKLSKLTAESWLNMAP